ncbi:MAG: tail fiber domain-containing protein, partial [Bacteroidia bacterium]|nr:tail fiber domain-containing protein [Bacteroidia bacterium]
WSVVELGSAFNFTGTHYGAVNRISIYAGQTGNVEGVTGSTNDASHAGTGILNNASGGVFYVTNIGTGTINNGYGVLISTVSGINKWSLYAADGSAPSYFAGAVGIGTTAPTASLSVNGAANNTTGAWSIFSDLRVKTVNSEFTDGLNVINKIRPVRFTYNANAPFNTKDQQIGIVAQELEILAPYMVNKKDYKDIKDLREVNSQAYTFLLINAVKELNAQNMNQQKQIDELKKSIELLQKK